MNDGAFVSHIDPLGQVLLNTTITHLTLQDEGDLVNLFIGDVVELSGKIMINEVENGLLDFIVDPPEIKPTDCCPVIRKCTTRSKKYCGVIVEVIEAGNEIEIGEMSLMKQKVTTLKKCYKFATHGDFLVKVPNSNSYNVGDTILSDLSVLGDEETITNLKISCTIGKVSKIINNEYIAIFKG